MWENADYFYSQKYESSSDQKLKKKDVLEKKMVVKT